MKIAVAVHNTVRQDARVIKEAQTLKATGHDVRIFGLSPDGHEHFQLEKAIPVHLTHRTTARIPEILEEFGLEPTRENKVWASFTLQGRLVFEAVRDTMQPDAVHIHDHVSLTAASSYKDEFQVPIVWDAHEIYEELAGLEDVRRNVNPRIIRENSQYIDAFITLNESIAAVYAERYPELPTAVQIPNATTFAAFPEYDGRLHHAAGLDRDQRILLFQGGFAPHRGIEALLDTAALLNSEWSLVFMGWGKLQVEIEERAVALNDRSQGRDRIAIVPGAPHSELAQWTAGATLGCIPYEDTGLNHRFCTPNKLWEFPASGVPIVATDLPEMAARINRASMGLTISPELNPKSIAETINSLSDAELERMRSGTRAFIENDNWSVYEPLLRDVYKRLERRPNPVRALIRSLRRRSESTK
ncbi:glycosyltransferase family 4 protein [Agrococcus casei]|uniref:glycosyltransferase family 4 protein n=1 Tax=Agrococcus casei TaxID=343512 RepID=UPI003F931388